MLVIKKLINRLSKKQKITCLVLLLVLIIIISVGIPTLARYKVRVVDISIPVWDGTVASSYKSGTGTVSDPYIISNGQELAYFQAQLQSNSYANTYFALSKDIILNNGVFSYDTTNGLRYTINSVAYYVGNYSGNYYDNIGRTGTPIGTVMTFNSLDNFKGHFDGQSHRITGLYVTDANKEEIALFTNLQGDVHDLYIENASVYGGMVTGGLASSTNGTTLSNDMFSGFVIGNSTLSSKTINSVATSPIIYIERTATTNYITTNSEIPYIGNEVASASITGNYVITGSPESKVSIKINGVTVTGGSFNVNLGNTAMTSIPVVTSVSDNGNASLTFSDLNYNVTYKYGVSGGIIAKSINTSIKNTINKAYVYGYSTGGGLVGLTTDVLNIEQSYNTGNVTSSYVSGGLIGAIEESNNSIVISNSYNSGNMIATNIGGLIGYIDNNTGGVSLTNVFNTSSTDYSIGTISGTTVNVSNAYYVNGSTAIKSGITSGSFSSTTIANLKTKSYDINNLSFNEFVSFTDVAANAQNVWIYDYDSLPILFADDISKPIASINASTYSWNNLSYDLSPITIKSSNITFNIEDKDALRPLLAKYYYISNTVLTPTQLDAVSSWTPYTNIVQIAEEGRYVIYAKVVDGSSNVTYLNTDLLTLDIPNPAARISLGSNNWTTLRSSLSSVYISTPTTVTVSPVDIFPGIASIKYYVTDQILDTTQLNALNTSSWITYTDGVLVNSPGYEIIYIKVVDNDNVTSYMNTDYIVYGGYNENSISVGRDSSSYVGATPYISSKSSITLNTSYTAPQTNNFSGYTHNLMSNILLPQGTKLRLLDNINKKVYEYKITTSDDIYNYNSSCPVGDLNCIKSATYPFTLFKEVGAGTTKLFAESSYYNSGNISENFSVIVDLSDTNISTNYSDVSLYFELHNGSGVNLRPTLTSTLKKFNIYNSVSGGSASGTLSLSTDYTGNAILYNSESTTNINITSALTYKNTSGIDIIDTTYENKKMGLAIKLVDSDGVTITKDKFKNITFKIGNDTYYPEEDNIVHINLFSGITNVTKVLTIITNMDNSFLTTGSYHFVISNYASYDGNYYDELGDTQLSIPVNVVDTKIPTNYNFTVNMNDENRIISKNTANTNVLFNIIQSGLSNPNIRVSLYKKDQLTAYNQSYSIVDLKDYVSNDLNTCTSNVYYVSTNPTLNNTFELDLISANFLNTGYKFVFTLYDGTKKISTIDKYFIVK